MSDSRIAATHGTRNEFVELAVFKVESAETEFNACISYANINGIPCCPLFVQSIFLVMRDIRGLIVSVYNARTGGVTLEMAVTASQQVCVLLQGVQVMIEQLGRAVLGIDSMAVVPLLHVNAPRVSYAEVVVQSVAHSPVQSDAHSPVSSTTGSDLEGTEDAYWDDVVQEISNGGVSRSASPEPEVFDVDSFFA
eukprot:387429-Rhodomonas_salina.3